MDDVLILLALALWSGLWLLREHGTGSVSRRHASASLRPAVRRRSVPAPVAEPATEPIDARLAQQGRTPS